MSVDLDKLDRLEERAASASDTHFARFERYRARVQAANVKRAGAICTEIARWHFGRMSLAQLATVPPQDLQAAGVDMALLSGALRDAKAANDMLAEHQRDATTVQQQLVLVRRLRQFAGRE